MQPCLNSLRLNKVIRLNVCLDPDSLYKAVSLLVAITLTITQPWFRLYEDSSGDLPVVG